MAADPNPGGPSPEPPPPPDAGPRRGAFDRVPPHNLDAEVGAIGSMLLSKDAADEVREVLIPEDFYRGAHRTMFEAASALMERGGEVDPITLADELERRGTLEDIGGTVAIARLLDQVPTAANASYYAQIVAEQAMRRRLIEVGTQVTSLGYDAGVEASDALDRAETEIFALGQKGQRTEFTSMHDLLSQSMLILEQLSESNNAITGLPTGFKDFDELTTGLQPANLFILAARPAMGKSTLVTNMASHVAVEQRRPAVLFSLEMSQLELVMRLLSAEARISSQTLRTGRLADSEWSKVAQAIGRLSEAPLFIDDTPGITLTEIRAKCRRLKAQRGLDLVVIDYLQLMTPSRRADNRVQEVAEISRGLKILAKELSLPVIALSQLSRRPEERTDRRPQLSDLRESGCLVAETRILRADTGAEVTLGELVATGERNVLVWSLDNGGRIVAACLTHAFPSGVKETFELRLASGRRVEASANHRFRTLDGWVALEDLAAGDRLAVPRTAPEPHDHEEWAEAEVVMLAHLIGDGCMAPRQPLHYTSADPANLDAVADAAAHFGITPRRVAQDSWWHLYLPAPQKLARGRRNPVVAWLDELGLAGARSRDKFVPRRVWGLSTSQIALFLRHLWATDGHLGERAGGVTAYYASSSRQLADDVQSLLLRFGIHSRLRTNIERRTGRPAHQVWISGADDLRTFLRRIGVHGARGARVAELTALMGERATNTNVDTVPKEVWGQVRSAMSTAGVSARGLAAGLEMSYCGSSLYRSAPSRERLARVATVLDDEHLAGLATNDVFWDAVVAIEPLGPRDVFDATVEGTHCFIANGIVAHNSIEQDADIVGFIYRDEVYNEDSEVKGEAELIIAKHRAGPTKTLRLAFMGETSRFANLSRGGRGGGAPPPPNAPPTDAF